jgi:hypothetical protein
MNRYAAVPQIPPSHKPHKKARHLNEIASLYNKPGPNP